MTEDVYTHLSNIELEKAFLGTLFFYPEEVPLVDMTPHDLANHRNAAVYAAIRALDECGQVVDIQTVHNYLVAHNQSEMSGGFAYLMELVGGTGLSIGRRPLDFAPDLIELSIRRRLLREANELARAALDRARDVHDTIGDFSTRLPRLVRVRGGAEHISVYVSQYYDRVCELMENPDLAAARTMHSGMLDYDEITGGARGGELLLLLGKPGLGKTKWAHQFGAGLAKNSFPGAIFQCETSEDEIMDREFSRETHIPSERLESGRLEEDEVPVFTQAVERMASPDNPLYLSFSSGWNTVTLRAELTRLRAEYGIRWFVFDYMRFLTDRYGESETERENYISIQLKRICRDLDLFGLVIHSMNKAGIASSSPELEHGSGGAGISYDCDKALFMIEHTPEDDQEPRYAHYRTFVFRKSRRKLARPVFHMQALRDRPEFVPPTLSAQRAPSAQRPARRARSNAP